MSSWRKKKDVILLLPRNGITKMVFCENRSWLHIHFRWTHWGRVTHICVGNLTIIGSDNGLSPGRRQAIIWTNAGILLIGHLGTNFSEILIEIHTFSFMNMHFKMSSAKWRLFGLGLNELSCCPCPIDRQEFQTWRQTGWHHWDVVVH